MWISSSIWIVDRVPLIASKPKEAKKSRVNRYLKIASSVHLIYYFGCPAHCHRLLIIKVREMPKHRANVGGRHCFSHTLLALPDENSLENIKRLRANPLASKRVISTFSRP